MKTYIMHYYHPKQSRIYSNPTVYSTTDLQKFLDSMYTALDLNYEIVFVETKEGETNENQN